MGTRYVIRVMEMWGIVKMVIQSLNSTLTQVGEFCEVNCTSIKLFFKKGDDTYFIEPFMYVDLLEQCQE